MIYTLFAVGAILIVLAIRSIMKILKNTPAPLNIPFPQHKDKGIVIVKLSDLSALWADRINSSKPSLLESTQAILVQEPIPVPAPYKMTISEELQQGLAPQVNTPIEVQPDNSLCSAEFFQYLVDRTNENINVCIGKVFDAFSFGDTVYVNPTALWRYTCDYAVSRNIKGHDNKNRHSIILSITKQFNDAGYIRPGELEPGYFGCRYSIIPTSSRSKLKDKGFYLPLDASFFNIERKKEGLLNEIAKIEKASK